MKTYEVIISKSQPTCGGKDPKTVEFQTVSTEDPVAFIRSRHPKTEFFASETTKDGTIVITFHEGARDFKYEFTEE